jgi:hypothetical protein
MPTVGLLCWIPCVGGGPPSKKFLRRPMLAGQNLRGSGSGRMNSGANCHKAIKIGHYLDSSSLKGDQTLLLRPFLQHLPR